MSLATPRLHSLALPGGQLPVRLGPFYVANPISSIASRPHCKHLPGMTPGFGAGLVIPDLWQQEAVRALQQGKDVVVQAPTGSGKTYIFELLIRT